MELNREDIIKALECWCDDVCVGEKCPYYVYHNFCVPRISKDALTLIKDQAEQIFKLENRLKECENGYEGTLFLDRCKLHDAEEKVKQLTEENERLKADAVPRREVERYMLKADGSLEMIPTVESVRQDVAREIFAELEQTVMHPNWASQTYKEWYFAELKKKYIGE
jgi:hypothetical protein